TFSNVVVVSSSNAGSSTNSLAGTGAVAPAASFSGSPTSGLKPLTVSFSDNSSGTITNRFWDFGDSSTTNTTATNFSHTYLAAGTNTVSLTVSGPLGTSTLPRTGYIAVTNPPPLLAISPANLSFGAVVIGQTNTLSFQVVNGGGLTLTGAVSATLPFAIAGGGPFTIVSGTPFSLAGFGSTNVVVRFAPTNAATFSNVVVISSSNAGSSTNALAGTGAVAPAASFSGSPTSGLNPLTVSFSDNSSGTITNRFWDFGDSSTTNRSEERRVGKEGRYRW